MSAGTERSVKTSLIRLMLTHLSHVVRGRPIWHKHVQVYRQSNTAHSRNSTLVTAGRTFLCVENYTSIRELGVGSYVSTILWTCAFSF